MIWRGGETGDFELKLEYRVSAQGNSGTNYRSTEVPGTKWALQGYQDDIDGKDQWSGQNYEEGDRGELQKKIHKEDWNQIHIIARGNLLRHFTNGVLMSEVRDEDPALRRMSGLLGVQVHVDPPMRIEFRRIRLKVLK